MTVLRKLRRVYTDDRLINQIQSHVSEVLDGLRLADILEGNLVTATITTAGTQIPHNLGRTPQGWILVDKTDYSDVCRVSWDKTFITLVSSTVDIDATIWVF